MSFMRAVYPLVMAGLVPAIHVWLSSTLLNVDARDEPGHDGVEAFAPAMTALTSPSSRTSP
ncbi:hypothetical protein DAA51_00910 [Bradyrhizobium sp. WBAH10]|nr:hypothetical protein DAA51_00910 [Bradyrhizobium sp. WBAH10]QCJ87417.1 hypothetical protein DAA57_02020 [Bradyrhizobium yuanmingense]